MKITLRNDFHETKSVCLIPPKGGWLSERTTNRVLNQLCGIKEYVCGSIRGQQELPEGWIVVEAEHQMENRIYIGPA